MNYINKLIYIHTRRKYLKKRQNGGCENISPLSIFKNAPEYIDPSGHFVFYKIVCRSNVYNAKYLRQFWINYNNFSSIFLWYLSTNFGRKIFNFNYQQNLENIVYVKFHKEGRKQNFISYYTFFFKASFGIYLQASFWSISEPTTRRTSRTSSRRSSTKKVKIQIQFHIILAKA